MIFTYTVNTSICWNFHLICEWRFSLTKETKSNTISKWVWNYRFAIHCLHLNFEKQLKVQKNSFSTNFVESFVTRSQSKSDISKLTNMIKTMLKKIGENKVLLISEAEQLIKDLSLINLWIYSPLPLILQQLTETEKKIKQVLVFRFKKHFTRYNFLQYLKRTVARFWRTDLFGFLKRVETLISIKW